MMDVAVRRNQINRELIPLRQQRSDNVSQRNRLDQNLEELRQANTRLRMQLDADQNLARRYERHENQIQREVFHGTRRRQYGGKIVGVVNAVRRQWNLHQQNVTTLQRHIQRMEADRNNLNLMIQRQTNRIDLLEAQLRTL